MKALPAAGTLSFDGLPGERHLFRPLAAPRVSRPLTGGRKVRRTGAIREK